MRARALLLNFLLIIVLTGCGGGGGSSTPATTSATVESNSGGPAPSPVVPTPSPVASPTPSKGPSTATLILVVGGSTPWMVIGYDSQRHPIYTPTAQPPSAAGQVLFTDVPTSVRSLLIGPQAGTGSSALYHQLTTFTAGKILTLDNPAVTCAALSSLAVDPPAITLPRGDTHPLHAMGKFTDGDVVDITAFTTWSSSDPRLVEVVPSPLQAHALRAGLALLTARFANMSAVCGVTVDPSLRLTSITVSPAASSIPVGVAIPFSATATYSNGTARDVTGSVSWISSDNAVATVHGGLVKAVALGQVTVQALQPYLQVSGTSKVQVTAATLQSISVTPVGALPFGPSPATLPAGLALKLRATGSFSDGSQRDITRSVSWRTSDNTIANVSNSFDSQGLVSAVKAGQVAISASAAAAPGVSTAVVAGSLPVTVTSAVLVGVTVTPSAPSVALGLPVQLTATARYSDRSTSDVTASVAWTTSNSDHATMSSTQPGQVLTHDIGPVTVTATDVASGIGASAIVTVTLPTLVSLVVTPATPALQQGQTVQMTATANYTDGPVKANSSAWTSSNPAVATVSASGVVTAIAAGSAQITATYQGLSSSAAVSVTASTPVGLQFSVGSPWKIQGGTTASLQVLLTYADGFSQDVTQQTQLTVGVPQVVTVDSDGTVTAQFIQGTGTTNTQLSAAYGGFTANLPVEVLQVSPVSVTAYGPGNVDFGENATYTAMVMYSNNLQQDVTALATFSEQTGCLALVSGSTFRARREGTDNVVPSYLDLYQIGAPVLVGNE